MTNCRDCKFYGGEIIIDEEMYARCDFDGDIIEMCIAEEENLGCDLYVENVDDNETSQSKA